MKKAIVTGANGFIGSVLTKYLSNMGIEVYAIVKDVNENIETIKELSNVKILHYELAQLKNLPENIADRSFDVFYHLAWMGTRPELRNDAETQLLNVDFSIDALRISKKLDCKKYITLGSPLEYQTETECINEKLRLCPQNLYASAKSAIRLIGNNMAKNIGQDINYVVLASSYGINRDDGNILTYTITSLLRKEKPILSSLTQRWDFIHVNDAARALYLIGEKGAKEKFYTVGNGENRQLKEIILLIRDMIDKELPLGIGELPNTARPFSSIIDTFEVYKDTGFKSEIPFEKGIAAVIEHYKNRG